MYESRFSKLENGMAGIKWMLGFIIALLAAVDLKLLLH
jgi:hypothetical protein